MNIIVAILILGIIIIIHELGHFLLAKKNGITVTEFSVGMGPRIASFVKNGTRYSLKLLPIGGSCMMLGEDETIDDEGAFNKKGVGARFSVIIAGAFFNFILAFVLALIVLGAQGVDLPMIEKVVLHSPAENAGLMKGDQIIAIDGSKMHFGREVDYYYYLNPFTGEDVDITVQREGSKDPIKVTLTPEMTSIYYIGCSYDGNEKTAILSSITPGYPLEDAELIAGDVIINVDGTEINTGKELADYFDANPPSDKPISLTYQRVGKDTTVTIIPKLYMEDYDIGLRYDFRYEKVSALDVIKYSFYELKFTIVSTIQNLGFLITGKISMKEVAGPVGIVNMVGDVVSANKVNGIEFTLLILARFIIFISTNLGVMNLLPIPALDGGRLVFIVLEAIRRKPVPKEKEAFVHFLGMAALMVLMVFVLFNDLFRIFK